MRIVVVACLFAAGCIMTPGLSIERTGLGSGRVKSDVNGINCGESDVNGIGRGEVCGALVEGPITLTAWPASDSLFAGWSGVDGCGTERTCSFTPMTDMVIEARFDRFYPTLTVIPSDLGTVFARGINCGTDCEETYDYNTFITLTVSAGVQASLIRWNGVPCTPPAACTFQIRQSYVAEPLLAPSP